MTQQMNLQRGLVGHWTMDDRDTSGGTLYDRSAYDNHGSVSTTTGQSGIIGESYEFSGSGSSDEVNVSSSSSLRRPEDTEEVTVSAWVNPSLTNMDGKGTVCTFSNIYYFQVESDGRIACYTYNDGSSSSYFNSATSLPENTWSHIAFTETGGTRRIYIDGELDNSGSFTASIGNKGVKGIGIGSQVDDSGRRYDGRIDDVRVYDRAISASEVNALYQMRTQKHYNV